VRALTESTSLRRFLAELGLATREPARVYLTGGASAVLLGWRASTIDIDLELVPDRDDLLRAIAALKNRLQVNVELVSPPHFVPELPGWQERSVFVTQEGLLSVFHYDFYSQALAKIERGHDRDRQDVAAMMERGLVDGSRLRELFESVSDQLYRYPAIDPESLRRAVDETVAR
jgi:hypothetical protein